jgi:MFS family permease
MRGRSIALWQVAMQGTTPIGGPLIGWIIGESDPKVGLAVGGLACLVAAVGGVVLARHFRVLRAEGALHQLPPATEEAPALSA